ncbi:hypothetical protein [Alicyclobacillus acidocaldarius]|uniref:Uncharacterized protein n=1 Tax=Alicyclobacillus acidocaldarius subsp. acidocaldarius (strain ATCC 27009 / DSM 446 / BCRC 14685 / JCM 5260 / KCTC 1825 / NBRC 15652 / NCIMB 11725 / NRRL B-14509 / 104-IA) TaxID=521098 RepID=C8WVJ1_ALIAD|nr:hypothetical protein [Alicyclobacillus acidocaldarius]ACV58113.1 hypothetical protein Aaci_1076 [Alicyclobacillus acidocaldarius subsp. acidocaldarius DSM 446]
MNGRTATLTDVYSQLQQAMTPFMNVTVRISYFLNQATKPPVNVWDTTIHRISKINGAILVDYDEGILLLDEDTECEVRQTNGHDWLFLKHSDWCVIIVKWLDIPKKYRSFPRIQR